MKGQRSRSEEVKTHTKLASCLFGCTRGHTHERTHGRTTRKHNASAAGGRRHKMPGRRKRRRDIHGLEWKKTCGMGNVHETFLLRRLVVLGTAPRCPNWARLGTNLAQTWGLQNSKQFKWDMFFTASLSGLWKRAGKQLVLHRVPKKPSP